MTTKPANLRVRRDHGLWYGLKLLRSDGVQLPEALPAVIGQWPDAGVEDGGHAPHALDDHEDDEDPHQVVEVPAFIDEPDKESLNPNVHWGWMFTESDSSDDDDEVEPSDPAFAAGSSRAKQLVLRQVGRAAPSWPDQSRCWLPAWSTSCSHEMAFVFLPRGLPALRPSGRTARQALLRVLELTLEAHRSAVPRGALRKVKAAREAEGPRAE